MTIGTPVTKNTVLKISYGDTVMPAHLTSIYEARNYLESLQFYTMPLLAKGYGIEVDGKVAINAAADHDGDEEEMDLLGHISAQFEVWKNAFTPLFERYYHLDTEVLSKECISVATLKVQILSMELACNQFAQAKAHAQSLLHSSTADSSTSSPPMEDPTTNTCREILSLSSLVITNPGFTKGFSFDCGVLPAIFIAFFGCRDLVVKMEALDMLRGMRPRREGVWDSEILVKIGEMMLVGIGIGGAGIEP